MKFFYNYCALISIGNNVVVNSLEIFGPMPTQSIPSLVLNWMPLESRSNLQDKSLLSDRGSGTEGDGFVPVERLNYNRRIEIDVLGIEEIPDHPGGKRKGREEVHRNV